MRINAYRTTWNATENVGYIKYLENNGQWTNWIQYENILEYQVILMLLQNERPVYHRRTNTGKEIFYTDTEDTGIQD